jgi:hypothetical protein
MSIDAGPAYRPAESPVAVPKETRAPRPIDGRFEEAVTTAIVLVPGARAGVLHVRGTGRRGARTLQTAAVVGFCDPLAAEWSTGDVDATHGGTVDGRLVLPLAEGQREVGVLTLFDDDPSAPSNPHRPAFGPESVVTAEAVAAQITVTVDALRTVGQLSAALASRDLIGQAKGIVMERFRQTAEQAFDLLTRLSMDSNTPLVQICEQIVLSGEIPAKQ